MKQNLVDDLAYREAMTVAEANRVMDRHLEELVVCVEKLQKQELFSSEKPSLKEQQYLKSLLAKHIASLDFHSARESRRGHPWKWNTPVMNEFLAFGELVRKETLKAVLGEEKR